MNAALLPLQAYWKQRNRRERAILKVGGAVLLIALVYGLLIDPVNSQCERLQRSLPALRADVARFERDILAARGQSTVQNNDLAMLAAAAGLGPQQAKLNRINDKQQALHASVAPWSALTTLLGSARSQGWQLAKLSVRAGAEPGMVDADLEWTR